MEIKRRNPRFGYQRIADQIALAFDIPLDKDTVRHVLVQHYRPNPGSGGPSWLIFFGHSRDSLWSVDLFRCESLILNTRWVMVVMDQYARRIVGFVVHKKTLDGAAVCRMFGRILTGTPPPTYLSSDNDPLFEFHRWTDFVRIRVLAAPFPCRCLTMTLESPLDFKASAGNHAAAVCISFQLQREQ